MTDYNYLDRSIFKDAAMLVGVCGTAVAITFTFIGIISCGDVICKALLRQLVAKQAQPSTSSHENPMQSDTKADEPDPNTEESKSEKEDAPVSDDKESDESKPKVKKEAEHDMEVYVLGFAACWTLIPVLLSLNSAFAPLLRYKVSWGWRDDGCFIHEIGLWQSFRYWLYIWAILSIPSLFLMLLGLLIRDLSRMLDQLSTTQRGIDIQAQESKSEEVVPNTPSQAVSEPFEKI